MICAHSFVNTAAHKHWAPPLPILWRMGRIDTPAELARKRKRSPVADWQKEDGRRLGELLDAFRAKHGTRGTINEPGVGSQGWLANLCGVKQTAVSHFIRGAIPLNIRMLVRFARALGVTPDKISPTLAEDILWVKIGENAYSKAALDLARKIDVLKDTEAGRAAILFIDKTLLAESNFSDDEIVKNHEVFVSPLARSRIRRAQLTRTTGKIATNEELPLGDDDA